jgi:hypothetical protein
MALIGDETLKVRLILYKRTKTPAAFQEFLYANLQDDYRQKKAIHMAIKEKEYAMACELCVDRIKNRQAIDERLSLHNRFVLLLDASQKADDTINICWAAKWLFDETHKLKYYQILKATTDPDQWPNTAYELLDTLGYKRYESLLLDIHLHEKQ